MPFNRKKANHPVTLCRTLKKTISFSSRNDVYDYFRNFFPLIVVPCAMKSQIGVSCSLPRFHKFIYFVENSTSELFKTFYWVPEEINTSYFKNCTVYWFETIYVWNYRLDVVVIHTFDSNITVITLITTFSSIFLYRMSLVAM